MKKEQRENLAVVTKNWSSPIEFDVSMASYSTLRAGGRAAGLIDIYQLSELQEFVGLLHEQELAFRVVGRGSNILVTDKGFPGVVIRLKGELENIHSVENREHWGREDEKQLITVGAGCSLARFLSWCTQQGLSGLEFMTGIPGSVGGAVWMNAGALGGEISDCLHSMTLLNSSGKLIEVPRSELYFSYRRAELIEKEMKGLVVASACFALNVGVKEEVRSRCAVFLAQRKEKQPTGVASAGSFFKNPMGDAAGRLIEAAGLKGCSCGEAMVSPVHANFIVNTGKGTATDILTLMEQVQEKVFQKFAVRLEPEVEII
jgi:UDP-N-acetylmuramate dehydrogenase